MDAESIAAVFHEFIHECAPKADLETVEAIRKVFYAGASAMLGIMLDEWRPGNDEVLARHRLLVVMSECIYFCQTMSVDPDLVEHRPS